MNRAINCRNTHTINYNRKASWSLLLLALSGLYCAVEVRAEDFKSASAQLAEQSFALLDHLSKQHGDQSNPLVGPMASFAGDAATLRQALIHSDLGSAKSTMASLQADAAAIDQALAQHPGAIPADQWGALRLQVAKLGREIPRCSADCREAAANWLGSEPSTEVTANGYKPRIVIASRESTGAESIRLRGYFEGSALKSAGIYEGSSQLKAFKVGDIPGNQRVQFDLRLGGPSPATVLRVTDAQGRSAEAPVVDRNSGLAASSGAPDSPAYASPPIASGDNTTSHAEPASDGSTAEIPSHHPILTSPARRHTLGSRLTDVKINVLNLIRVGNLPPTYEIVGQIAGRGVTRAGIYLNGRLIQPIPIVTDSNYSSFDQRFVARGGPTSIRVYGVGKQFIQEPVDLDDAGDPSELANYPDEGSVMVTPLSAARVTIQIINVRALAGGLYFVTGSISGPNVASAGLYQNGVLVQNINADGGLVGALSALLPGASHAINFSVRFNPYAGPASIRAFDNTGAYTEQPLVVGGISPYVSTRPNPWYGSAGNLPYGRGLPASRYPSGIGAVPPLW